DLAASEGAGRIKTTREPGVYFALAGGILVLIGGVGGLVSGMRRTTPEAVPEGEFPAPYPTAPPPPANGEQTAQIASSPAEGPGSEPAPPPPPAQPMPPTPSDTDPAPPPRETEPPEQG